MAKVDFHNPSTAPNPSLVQCIRPLWRIGLYRSLPLAEAMGLALLLRRLELVQHPRRAGRIAGVLAERAGNFAPSFLMASAAAASAIVLCQMLKRPQ